MSQVSISSFFHTRKRGIDEEIAVNKRKVIRLDGAAENALTSSDDFSNDSANNITTISNETEISEKKSKALGSKTSTRQVLKPQRTTRSKAKHMQNVDGLETPKLVNFWVGGNLSPKKKSKNATTETITGQTNMSEKTVNNELSIVERPGMTTPVKSQSDASPATRKPLNIEEIKLKMKNSSRITELKTTLNKLNSGFDRLNNMRNERLDKGPTKEKKDDDVTPKQLKPFKTIEFQILSPSKRLTSPLKLRESPMKKNILLSSPISMAPKRLFSPIKGSLEMSPVKAPAYQRFQTLTEKADSQLQLPYKYRYLLDIFKAVDAVCAMFYNRKEKITFKKLKPAVQRILRKNFYESHLSQIQKLMPDAYKFAQEKTRNFGSTSKQDYFQLVITPNISSSSDSDLKELTLSPQLLIERSSTITRILTDLVFDEHQKFLQTLEVPMSVTRGALKRWHPEFDLESVPEVDQGNIPMPPNVEKFSSARDVLNTARNLFNCSTPMERALERLDEKKKADKALQKSDDEVTSQNQTDEPKLKEDNLPKTSALLKGVPQSLLDKIRAKQAAKALDTMTRRPSVEREAAKYARLPEVARHARNVYITEKKGVLPLENVLKKIENSYRGTVSMKEIEELLRIIAKEMPIWMSFHEIRNAMYLKLNRESDLTLVTTKLEKLATEKRNVK